MSKEYLLVTGASSGIGKNIAIYLSSKYNIILCGRSIDNLVATKDECDKSNNHLIWNFDLNNVGEVEKSLSEFIVSNNINIKYFVHCAGYMKMMPCKLFSLDTFFNSYNVNVISAAMIAKVLTSKKINNSSLESVVFISSNVSNFGAKAFSAYASSKSALDGLMRCLAVELAPKTRVNSVLPGGIKTEMTKNMEMLDEETEKRLYSQYPLGIGKPEYISKAVEFLLSNEAEWITGQQFTVDGGRTINITG